MSIGIEANLLVRILDQDSSASHQCVAACRLVAEANAAGEPLLVTLCALPRAASRGDATAVARVARWRAGRVASNNRVSRRDKPCGPI